MNFIANKRPLLAVFALLCGFPVLAQDVPGICPPEVPAVPVHMEQADIDAGLHSFQNVLDHGEFLFNVQFNACDGFGRPGTNGCLNSREPNEPHMTRLSGPEAHSCVECHNQPRAGGAGGFIANVFQFANCEDPVATTIDPLRLNERQTIGAFGTGLIEMLGREISADLKAQVAAGLPDGWNTLSSKNISFEIFIENGEATMGVGLSTVTNSELLDIKPYEAGGRQDSLRVFSANAFAQHHGMQPEGLFGPGDADQDGISRELTQGDITAVEIFQAAMATPQRILPPGISTSVVRRGSNLFESIGCASCHMPELVLDSSIYSAVSGGSNGNVQVFYSFDMLTTGEEPRPEAGPTSGSAIVRAYTDLKIHHMCDPVEQPDAVRHFCNETVHGKLESELPDNNRIMRPANEFFLTRRLWDVGNSAPYGHRGDLSTITEAILAHGGEARLSRDQFVALRPGQQSSIVAFLKGLIVPQQQGRVLVPGEP